MANRLLTSYRWAKGWPPCTTSIFSSNTSIPRENANIPRRLMYCWRRNIFRQESMRRQCPHTSSTAAAISIRGIVSYSTPIQSNINHPFTIAVASASSRAKTEDEHWTFREICFASLVCFCSSAALCFMSVESSPSSSATSRLSSTGIGGSLRPGGSPPPPPPEGNHNPDNSNFGSFLAPGAAISERDDVRLHSNNDLGQTQKNYEVSVCPLRGGRLTMEDTYCIANGGRFAAVYDGHGGAGVSSYLKDRLYGLLCHHLRRKNWEERDMDDPRSPSIASHVAALRDAFGQLDEEVLHNDSLAYQGSTAVVVVMHESDDGHRTLLSANVGDSRAILCRRGKAVDLTRDHKPNDEREKARIMAMGETIEWDSCSKVHRVGRLSVSRAIGDRFAKPAVSGEVEIKHFPVAEDGDDFILLASDGLWDVMSSQDVVSFVESRLRVGRMPLDAEENLRKRRQNMARYVASEALRKGSADNVCVLIVWLKEP